MEMREKYNYRQTGITLLACIFIGSLTTTVLAQQANLPKTAVKPIDPASIDLTQPTLFIVPYSHLDDFWRWSYPQTIRDFLKRTLDENFEAFEEYPNYVFNWSGASRYQMM
jgi:alpha-mannosidase